MTGDSTLARAVRAHVCQVSSVQVWSRQLTCAAAAAASAGAGPDASSSSSLSLSSHSLDERTLELKICQ